MLTSRPKASCVKESHEVAESVLSSCTVSAVRLLPNRSSQTEDPADGVRDNRSAVVSRSRAVARWPKSIRNIRSRCSCSWIQTAGTALNRKTLSRLCERASRKRRHRVFRGDDPGRNETHRSISLTPIH